MQLTLPRSPVRQLILKRHAHRGPDVNFVWDAPPFANLSRRPQVNACSGCRSWEALDASDPQSAGLCRRFALTAQNNSWRITEQGDWCNHWQRQRETTPQTAA